MKKITLLAFLICVCIPGISQSINELKKIFDYDKGEYLDYRELSIKDTTQGTIHFIVFSSVNGLKVTANLIIPHQQLHEFPVVIFLNDGSQSKDEFLPQALALAANAIASLLIDALPARPDLFRVNYHNFAEPIKDFNAFRQAVLDIRRSIDLLEQHPSIDRNRIAFIGNGDGALTGSIVSGIETRISGYIFMFSNSCYSCDLKNSNNPIFSKARNDLTSEQINHYESVIKPLNPDNYLPHHRNTLIFFQFAQNDPYFDESTAKSIIQLTKDPKSYKFYKTTNSGLLLFQESIADQKKWLKEHL